MKRRFVSIWFRHLATDYMEHRQPELKDTPFVLSATERGRMVIRAVSAAAKAMGIEAGTVVADARAVYPALKVLNSEPELPGVLLQALATSCMQYTPAVAVDLPDGLLLDITGCAHLWGGEQPYLRELLDRIRKAGYRARAALADTVGTAWAVARYGQVKAIIPSGGEQEALLPLPPAALRLEPETLELMHKLGFYRVANFIHMPGSVLRRRFGALFLERLAQALGETNEALQLLQPVVPYQERLPSPEPIRTASGIGIALQRLLESLCQRLLQEGKGLRKAVFKGFRVDGNLQQIEIGTNRPVRNINHLFRLFELKINTLTPGLGIELFLLEAPVVEDLTQVQESLWNAANGYDNGAVTNLLDRVAGKIGPGNIHRYMPDEHYWPERSFKPAASLREQPAVAWRNDMPRPICLLPQPERVDVMVPIPDYPPLLFIYKGITHKIVKADGPERIEEEWWQDESLHRDYYCVEDEGGNRYWLFRLGHYGEHNPDWFIHGFFA